MTKQIKHHRFMRDRKFKKRGRSYQAGGKYFGNRLSAAKKYAEKEGVNIVSKVKRNCKKNKKNDSYKIFHLDRVSYARTDTPIEKREYRVREFKSSAVGSVNEIADFIRDKFLLWKGVKVKKFILRTSDMGDIRFNFNIEV